MNYILQSLNNTSGYRMQNTSNLYNFIFDCMELVEDAQQKKQIIKLLKKNLGNTVFEEYHYYIIRKKLAPADFFD